VGENAKVAIDKLLRVAMLLVHSIGREIKDHFHGSTGQSGFQLLGVERRDRNYFYT